MSLTIARNEVASGSRWNLVLLALDIVGAIIYVLAASHSWAIPQEHGAVPVSGEPFVWALFVIPIYAVFGLVNVSWGAYILFKRRWQSGYFWLMAAAVWLIAIVVDFAHH
jgi:hypothetical protein